MGNKFSKEMKHELLMADIQAWPTMEQHALTFFVAYGTLIMAATSIMNAFPNYTLTLWIMAVFIVILIGLILNSIIGLMFHKRKLRKRLSEFYPLN